MNMRRSTTHLLLLLLLAASLAAGACSKPSDATPTPDLALIQTYAVATFSIGLTQTAMSLPTATPTPTPTETPTATPSPTVSPTSGVVILPTSSCNSLAFVSDVTIPDNTKMAPGQTFTKTWRVKNTGTCDWEADFQVKFFSGNAMGGTSLKLNKIVTAGKETEISIAMTAPANTGVYTGNWRMADDTGAFFGDSFYVMINVITGTITVTIPPASPTATTEVPPSATTEP